MVKSWLVLCFLGFSFVFTSSAAAKEAVTTEKDGKTLDTVIVSATKTQEKRKDIPNAVTYKDQQDIRESSAVSLGDFLSNDPGLDWRTRGNYGGAAEEIHIRGMSGNATQVLVNGIVMNSPSLGSADVGRIPMNSIERIEVIKGSGSVLYGSGAMGGTINVITKSPHRDRMDLRASAGYGTRDTYVISAEQGMFVWGDFGYYLTANYRSTDGFRGNSDLDHRDVSLKLVYDREDVLNVSLYGDYIDRDYGLPGPEPDDADDFYFNGEHVYSDESASLLDRGGDKDGHAGLEIKTRPLEWLGFTLRGDYTDMENSNYSRWYSNFIFPPDMQGSAAKTENKVETAEGHVEIGPLMGAKLLAGAQYREYRWENRSVDLDPEGDELDSTETILRENLHTTGTFAEAQYRPCRYVKVLAGLRYEDHSEFGDEVLPRFGLIVNPLESTAIKFSHGRHFKAPTPNDLFWPEGLYTRGNPDLDPEIGWHSDVTVEQSLFDDRLFLTLTYFHWDLEDKIQWGADDQGIWEPQNLREYEADGVEAGAQIGPFQGVTLGLHYTYLDATEENREYYYQSWFPVPDLRYEWEERRAAYTPEHQFKGVLAYESPFGLTVSATARYVGERVFYRDEQENPPLGTGYETVKYKLDAYWTMDLKLQQRLFDHWVLAIEGTNLSDKEYDTYFGSFTDYNKLGPWGTPGLTTLEPYPGAGRAVLATMTFEY